MERVEVKEFSRVQVIEFSSRLYFYDLNTWLNNNRDKEIIDIKYTGTRALVIYRETIARR